MTTIGQLLDDLLLFELDARVTFENGFITAWQKDKLLGYITENGDITVAEKEVA